MATVTAWKQAHRCTVSARVAACAATREASASPSGKGFRARGEAAPAPPWGASAHAAARRPDRSHIPDTINNRPDFPDLISGKSGRFSVMPHRKGGPDRGLKHAAPNTRRPGGVRAACLHSRQPRFMVSIRASSACACVARSATALAASAMASAVCRDMLLICTMVWLISSLAADCSSLAVAMAFT